MDILLDTCSTLWYFNGNDEMPQSARETILNSENTIYVSIATIWEVAIKMSIGKLDFNSGIDGFINAIEDEGFLLLDITTKHIKAVNELPFVHRDPFDRMIVAQAIVEELPIMTTDSDIIKYEIETIWRRSKF
jgi:PIN domain nuclease of toxin-antitoxin system